MGCNCRWCETILALIILVFALFVNASWGEWVVIIAAVLLLIHAWSCKNCGTCMPEKSASKPASSRKRR